MTPESNSGEVFQPLPFTYTRVFDSEMAQYSYSRIPGIRPVGARNEPLSDEVIKDRVKERFESQEWFYSEYWRSKGIPSEQIEFQIGEQLITLYNFNEGLQVSDEHIDETLGVLAEFASRFPQVLDNLRWILIDNIQPLSSYGDSINYPLNGEAVVNWKAFKLQPRGMSLEPHRVPSATNFEGTLVHEMTHLIDSRFEAAGWREKYKWERCIDSPEDWEPREVPDGGKEAFYNKHTGKMALIGMYALQPDECVTEYAQQNIDDDVCDSMVAYFFDRDLLKSRSTTKLSIIASQDEGLLRPLVTAKRVSNDEIKLPPITPQVVNFYIKEPVV